MKRNWSALIGIVCFLGLQGLAFAGGTLITSTQDGDWSLGTTWVGGVVPVKGSSDQVFIEHTVDVTTAGEGSNVLIIGKGIGGGTVNMLAGDLTISNPIELGSSSSGTLNLSGGTITAPGLRIPWPYVASTVEITGGSLILSTTGTAIELGVNSVPGTLKIAGFKSSISVNSSSAGLNIGDNGTLIVQPVANGSAGLTTLAISTGSVTLGTSSTLALDISSYTPSVGDQWDVITSPDTITGSFGTLSAPDGYTITQTTAAARGATPEKIVIEVTAVPTPVAWVDFGFGGVEDGSELNPWNTLAEGLANISAGGIVNIKGDTGTSATIETPTINQEVTLVAPSGPVMIGITARAAGQSSENGFVSRGNKRE